MRNLKRILALALTVLMVFGALPFTAFAQDELPEVDYSDVKFGESNLEGLIKSDKSYWQKIPYQSGNVDPTGRVISGSRLFTYRSGVTVFNDNAGLLENVWKKNEAGLDVLLDMSIKLDNSKTGSMLIGVLHHIKGGITLLDARSYGDGTAELYYYNSENSGATAKKLCDLPSDSYTSVQVLLDVGGTSASDDSNTVYVFLDGKLAVTDKFLSTSALTAEYKTFTDNAASDAGYAKGFLLSGYFFNPASTAAVIDVEKFTPYYYDTDANGNVSDTPREQLIVPSNTVNEGLVQSLYHSDKNYWSKLTLAPDAAGNTISHSANYRWFAVREGLTAFNDQTGLSTNVWQKNLAGLDTVLDMSFKLDNSKSGEMLIGLLHYYKGGITLLEARSYGNGFAELYYTNTENSGATERKLCDLPADKYTNVQILLDVGGTSAADEANTIYIFIDGTLVYNDAFLASGTITQEYKFFTSNDYAKGFMASGYFFNPYSSAAVIDVQKCNMYLYDDDADGDPSDSTRSNPVMHFNDFEDRKAGEVIAAGTGFAGTYKGVAAAATTKPALNVFRDTDGNKAIYTDATGDMYYQLFGQSVKGADFILSYDVKLKSATTSNGSMFWASSTGDVAWNLTPISTRTDGSLYIGKDYMLEQCFNGEFGDTKVGQLSTERFTNITIVFNVSSNIYRVYIDGIDTMGEMTMLNDTTKAKYGDAGFYLTQIRMQNRNYYLDNIALYYGDSFARELESQQDLTDFSGYLKKSGRLYLYENGQIAANKNIDQGIIVTDENGAVKVGDTYASSLSSIYTTLSNGDKVLVEGLYSGFYKTENNTYCYENGKMVKGGIRKDADVFYKFDESGAGALVTDAVVDLEGNKTYADIESAIANSESGATITLNNNIDLGDNAFAPNPGDDKNIIIDLNGKEIAANAFVTFGNVVIKDSGDGVIKVEKGNFNCEFKSDTDVVIWNEAKGGYTVSTVKNQVILTPDTSDTSFELIFRPALGSTALNKAVFSDDTQLTIDIIIKNKGEVIGGPYRFNDSVVKSVYKDNTKGLYVKVNNVDKEKFKNITIDYVITSDTGMSCQIEAGVVNQQKFSVIGDSISSYGGWIPAGNRAYYNGEWAHLPTNDVTDVSYTWWHMLMTEKHYKLEVNQSYSSSPVCNVGLNSTDASGFSFITRMKNIGNPDVIAIYGGTNDAFGAAEVGEYKYENWTADDLKTFRPAYAYMLDYLLTNHPDADIVVIIQPNLDTLKVGVADSIKEICDHYGVTYVELPETLDLHDKDGTNVHPSKLGMQQIFDTIKDYFD